MIFTIEEKLLLGQVLLSGADDTKESVLFHLENLVPDTETADFLKGLIKKIKDYPYVNLSAFSEEIVEEAILHEG